MLRRASIRLKEEVGVAPGPSLRRLERDILNHAEHLMGFPAGSASSQVEHVWSRAARSYEDAVPVAAPARLEASVTLLRALAVSGPAGLRAARRHRVEAIAAAEAMGDPRLTARVIASSDVPAVWMRSDDPAPAAQVVAAARRALAALGDDLPAVRARPLSIVALETRGARDDRAAAAAGTPRHARAGSEILRCWRSR